MNESILAAWSLPAPSKGLPLPTQGTNNRTWLVSSGDGLHVLKVYQTSATAESILYEHRMLAWLTQRNLSYAVPVPVRTRSGDTLAETEAGWAVLSPLIPGLPPDSHNMTQMEAVGAALGELHNAFAWCHQETRAGSAGYNKLNKVHPALPRPDELEPGDLGLRPTAGNWDLCRWWQGQVRAAAEFGSGCYQSLPRQVIHGDFTPANTLVDGGRVTGMVDFEFVGPDARALDVAAGLKFAMRVWEHPNHWLAGAAFCRGYRRHIRLSLPEIEAIPHLTRLRDVVSTIWWLGRSLEAGDTSGAQARMSALRDSAMWLTIHGERLVTMVATQQ